MVRGPFAVTSGAVHRSRRLLRSAAGTSLRVIEALTRGAAAGAVATAAMSALMLAAGRAGLVPRQPPEAIVRRVGALSGGEPRGRLADALAAVAHLGFGAATGAAYALLPRSARPVLRGTAVGELVYAVSYAGWVPALGALPAADRDHRPRQVTMAAAHVVYGAVLGALDDRWRR